MMAALKVDLVTPEGPVHSGPAALVVVPGVEGEMGFLPGHAPVLTALADGVVRVKPAQGEGDGSASDSPELSFVVQGGFVEVDGEGVRVLANRARDLAGLSADDLKAELGELSAKAEALADDPEARASVEELVRFDRVALKALGALG